MMRAVVTDGIGRAAQPLRAARPAKTGTAQTGRYTGNGEELVNAWFTGLWPSEAPRYTITVLLDEGRPFLHRRRAHFLAHGKRPLFAGGKEGLRPRGLHRAPCARKTPRRRQRRMPGLLFQKSAAPKGAPVLPALCSFKRPGNLSGLPGFSRRRHRFCRRAARSKLRQGPFPPWRRRWPWWTETKPSAAGRGGRHGAGYSGRHFRA